MANGWEAGQKFLEDLFAPYPIDGGLTLELRCIEKGEEVLQEWYGLEGWCLQRASAFARSIQHKVDCYFGVLPRNGRGDKQRHVTTAGWLWFDLDAGASSGPDVVAQYEKSGLAKPRWIVLSGSGGFHGYHRLTEPITLDDERRPQFTEVLRRLAQAIGGEAPAVHADKSVAEVARILRLPGTLNHKHTPAKPVQAVFCPDAEDHTFDWWCMSLPFEPARAVRKVYAVKPIATELDVPRGLLNWATTPYPEGKRHHDLAGAARFLKRECGLDNTIGRDLLWQKARLSLGQRSLTDVELERIWKWA